MPHMVAGATTGSEAGPPAIATAPADGTHGCKPGRQVDGEPAAGLQQAPPGPAQCKTKTLGQRPSLGSTCWAGVEALSRKVQCCSCRLSSSLSLQPPAQPSGRMTSPRPFLIFPPPRIPHSLAPLLTGRPPPFWWVTTCGRVSGPLYPPPRTGVQSAARTQDTRLAFGA